MSPRLSSPAASSQRWRQPFIVFRELASAPPLPQPPATHAHPAHTSIWPTEEPREVCGHMLIFIWAVINKRMYLHSSKNSEQSQRSLKEEQVVLHIMDPHAECVGRRDVQKHMQRPFASLDLIPLQMFHTETLVQHQALWDGVSLCVLSSQCRDWPEIAGNHETDGLSEDRRPGEMLIKVSF